MNPIRLPPRPDFPEKVTTGTTLMRVFTDYAREIGCTMGEGAMFDCIECTPEQGARLTAKWAALTE